MIIMSHKMIALGIAGMIFAGCSGGSLTTREKGAGIGVLGGAAAGGLIGTAVGRPGTGAAIGGAVGLGAGALIGDRMQGQERQQQYDANQQQIQQNQQTINRNNQQIQSHARANIRRNRLRCLLRDNPRESDY